MQSFGFLYWFFMRLVALLRENDSRYGMESSAHREETHEVYALSC